MQYAQTNVFLGRHDTFFGVCEAIGEDLGFNANYLRVAFGACVLFSPTAVVATYAALGVLVLLTRWLIPNRRAAKAEQPEMAQLQPVAGTPSDAKPEDREELAIAA